MNKNFMDSMSKVEIKPFDTESGCFGLQGENINPS